MAHFKATPCADSVPRPGRTESLTNGTGRYGLVVRALPSLVLSRSGLASDPPWRSGALALYPASLCVKAGSPIHSRRVFLSLVCWMKMSCSGGRAGSAVCGLLK